MRKGSSRLCLPWQGVPVAALCGHHPSFPRSPHACGHTCASRAKIPSRVLTKAGTRQICRICCRSWSPQKEGLLWWTTERPTRDANFPDFCSSRKFGLQAFQCIPDSELWTVGDCSLPLPWCFHYPHCCTQQILPCTESHFCQIELKGSSEKLKPLCLILPPGKSTEKYNFVVFQIKSDSGHSAVGFSQC